jgi:hypothetical protein
MLFGYVTSSPRGNLTLQQSLDLANMYLDCAARSQDPDIAMVFCHDTEVLLNNAKKAVKGANDPSLRQRVATSYIGLGRALDQQQCGPEAKAIYKKAEKMG